MDYCTTTSNNRRRDSYYQNDMEPYYQYDTTSPLQQQQLEPISYHRYPDANRFNINNDNKKEARRRRNSRVRNSMIDQQQQKYHMNSPHYYDEEQYHQQQQQHYNYYNHQQEDQPTTARPNGNRRRSSSSACYYKNGQREQDQFPYSPDQQYQEIIYSSPPQKKKVHQSKQRNYNNNSREQQKKYNDLPITPDDDERRSFVYATEVKEAENGIEDNAQVEDNEMLYYTGEQPQQQATAADKFFEDEEDDDEETHYNTMLNSESNNNSGMDYYSNISPISSLDIVDSQQPQPQQYQQNHQQQIKKKWGFKMMVNTAFNKVKTLNNTSRKRKGESVMSPPPSSYFPTGIQVITASNNELLGDVLNAKQQKEIITQLQQSPLPATSVQMSPEKTKITNLDRIWVFRLFDESREEQQEHPIAWIGFDYENQEKIENHIKELENGVPEEGRLAIYDSHIRHKSMPVIVTPQHEKGYYFSDVNQTQLITLEVTFIDNHYQKVTFVYRV